MARGLCRRILLARRRRCFGPACGSRYGRRTATSRHNRGLISVLMAAWAICWISHPSLSLSPIRAPANRNSRLTVSLMTTLLARLLPPEMR